MLKIRALNRESSSDEDVTVIRREAQEEIVLELYNKALRLQASGGLAESEGILLKLIDENIPLLENNGGLPKSMSTLKYSCLLNVGYIYLRQEEQLKALDKFLLASELDSTDVTLWHKIGKLALKENKFRQSAYAFSKGLECNENHWPCLDQLITILYAMKDTVACLEYIGKALILDPDYLKGLVLRQQIYRDNPATKEYYQLYNADHIWEPPLDVNIDEEDERKCLDEVQVLCDRITEVERALRPKPLETIPLPRKLNDFSWVDLAKTVNHLHQYITDNGMSHFTMIDLNKCMSEEIDLVENLVSEPPSKTVEKSPEVVLENIQEQKSDEKMETESIPERRFSQNSETNNEIQESTPVQTDIDEDQPADQENEDPDENNETKIDRSRPRGTKRKRDLLLDLQVWGWHSKRKASKKGKHEKDYIVEDALNRIIPNNLLLNKIAANQYSHNDDSMNTMDLYNLYVDNREVNYLSPIHSPKSVNYEPYFGTDRERNDVSEFLIKERECCDAVALIKDLVFSLSLLWNYRWPKQLIPLYIEAYNMFREHCDPPQVFCGTATFEEIRSDALATLLYGELLSFSTDSDETVHGALLTFLQVISGWNDCWQEDAVPFFVRVYWLRSYIFRKERNNDLANSALQLVQEVILEEELKTGEKYSLNLPNCHKYGIITNHIAEKLVKHLDMITSLSQIEELYNSEKYEEVAEIIKLTFTNLGSHPQVGRMGRPAQLALLLHSLWFTNMTECFIWTEECLYEALEHFLKPRKDANKWEKIIEKCLAIFQEIIKMETVSIVDSLSEEKRCRLVETLSKIICKQLSLEHGTKVALGCITPWILLHYILVREEHRQQANKRVSHIKTDKTENMNGYPEIRGELPPSIALLFSAHDFLGPKGWCLTGQGELLHFILDTVLDRLDTPIFEALREKIDIHIEQSFFCLYQHPSKKNKISRHLADHNVDPLPLTWERSFQLYEFYAPCSLPEFNSYKNASISAELEQLFKRIIALVPPNCNPQPMIPKILDYVYSRSEHVPDPVDFPNKIRPVYYLIGDFYFKQREFNRCLKYFQMDLCINPLRLDSWACLGLSYASQLESKLNYCKTLKSEAEFLDKAKSAQICFKKALSLAPEHTVLWIEFGAFEYMVHSFCSRLLKYESENLSMEKFEQLETLKESYLDSSGNSFENAIALYEADEGDQDERWLQYYILGKIAEKKRKEPSEYLQYYITASTLLHDNNATYPDKINYNNPPALAVEALEIHYRLHASVLKYLEMHEGKEIPNTLGSYFKKCISSSYFLKKPPAPPKDPPIPVPPKEPSVPVPPKNPTVASFQDAFINATKSNLLEVDEIAETIEDLTDEKKLNEDVKNCLDETLKKVENIMKLNEETQNNKSTETEAQAKNVGTIVEDVIMISDSEEEETRRNGKAVDVKEEQKQNENKPPKDIQQMLDEMMEETMKKTEEQISEMDSDISTTEKNDTCIQVIDIKPESLKEDGNENVKSDGSETSVKVTTKSTKNTESEVEDIRTSIEESSSSSGSSSSSSSSSDSDSEDDSSSSSSSSSDSSNENMSNSEIIQLVDRCIAGLEICIARLPQNYKALYRLAHLYFNYKAKKDPAKAKQLLLGEYKCKDGTLVTGLFADRKTNNFFNGVWRIPSTEIDRPGSLSAHMSRCISLLLQILRCTNDNKTLLELCMQLRRTPDPDKIYIKDSERMQFSEQAMTMCTQSLKAQIKGVPNMSNPSIAKLLQEIYRIYQRVQKHIPSKESIFSKMLTEVYTMFIKEKISDNVNVLDLATKFCQQSRPEKKAHQSLSAPLPRGPGMASPPVLPSPSTIGSSSHIAPLKRPGSGRPRGRPPLPKIPGQPRVPRGRSPATVSNSYSWQKPLIDQNLAMEYLKHYQEEILKQYKQNLNMSQLSQLSQLTPQLSTTLAASSLANQYLQGQSNLLNPSSSLKQASSGGSGAAPSSVSQMMDTININKLNPTVMKKPSEQMPHLPSTTSSSSYSLEHLKYLGNYLSQMSTTKSTSGSGKIPSAHTTMPHSSQNYKTKLTANISKTTTSNPKYSTADSKKVKTSASVKPFTPSVPQTFKEPPATKPHQVPHSEDYKTANLLMKERPSISITPVASVISAPIATTASTFIKSVPTSPKTLQEKLADKQMKPVTTSPGKTLQEILADKQKQHSTQFAKNIEAEIFSKEVPLSASSHSKGTGDVFGKEIPKTSANLIKNVAKEVPVSSTNIMKNIPKEMPMSSANYDIMKSFSSEFAMASANLMKSFNLPSIPSSLTVSKAVVSVTNPSFVPEPTSSSAPKKSLAHSTSNIPMDLGLPANLKVSKSPAPAHQPFPKDTNLSKSTTPSPTRYTDPSLNMSKSSVHPIHKYPIEANISPVMVAKLPVSSALPRYSMKDASLHSQSYSLPPPINKFSPDPPMPHSLSISRASVPIPTTKYSPEVVKSPTAHMNKPQTVQHHSSKFILDQTIPSSLTISKSTVPMPPNIKFPTESGISVSQVTPSATKEKSPTFKKDSNSNIYHPGQTFLPADILPVRQDKVDLQKKEKAKKDLKNTLNIQKAHNFLKKSAEASAKKFNKSEVPSLKKDHKSAEISLVPQAEKKFSSKGLHPSVSKKHVSSGKHVSRHGEEINSKSKVTSQKSGKKTTSEASVIDLSPKKLSSVREPVQMKRYSSSSDDDVILIE